MSNAQAPSSGPSLQPVPHPTYTMVPSFVPTTNTQAPTVSSTYAPTPQPTLFVQAPSSQPTSFVEASSVQSMTYSYSFLHSNSDCNYSSCSDEIIADINAGDQDLVCAHSDLSCVDGCISDYLLKAHCACDTGLLFVNSINSFNFFGEPYCCGSDACQDAVLNLYLATSDDASSLTNITYAASKALHDDECVTVNCTFTDSPSSMPTLVNYTHSVCINEVVYWNVSIDNAHILNGQYFCLCHAQFPTPVPTSLPTAKPTLSPSLVKEIVTHLRSHL